MEQTKTNTQTGAEAAAMSFEKYEKIMAILNLSDTVLRHLYAKHHVPDTPEVEEVMRKTNENFVAIKNKRLEDDPSAKPMTLERLTAILKELKVPEPIIWSAWYDRPFDLIDNQETEDYLKNNTRLMILLKAPWTRHIK